MNEQKKPQRINAELIYYQLDEIKNQLKDFKKDYVTKEESQALKDEIGELRLEIADIKRSRNLWSWLSPTLSAAFTAVVTYLVIEKLKGV
ncbi:hypothetical protein EKK58_09590 [Candidatus Dependentiae bacterium]|nr:MAG: hypothetical protein EKK58_09590 [Candidatus Dependentiae bacterium]